MIYGKIGLFNYSLHKTGTTTYTLVYGGAYLGLGRCQLGCRPAILWGLFMHILLNFVNSLFVTSTVHTYLPEIYEFPICCGCLSAAGIGKWCWVC